MAQDHSSEWNPVFFFQVLISRWHVIPEWLGTLRQANRRKNFRRVTWKNTVNRASGYNPVAGSENGRNPLSDSFLVHSMYWSLRCTDPFHVWLLRYTGSCDILWTGILAWSVHARLVWNVTDEPPHSRGSRGKSLRFPHTWWGAQYFTRKLFRRRYFAQPDQASLTWSYSKRVLVKLLQ